MKPHKHAELIKAWADGAEIECYFNGLKKWDSVSEPSWSEDFKYRIKPEPKKDPLKIIADLIHYPQCWDDFTYPTLEDAVIAVCENFNCTNEDTHQTKPLSVEEIWEIYKSWTRWIDGGYELQVVQFAKAIEAKVRGEK